MVFFSKLVVEADILSWSILPGEMHADSNSVTLSCTLFLGCTGTRSLLEFTGGGWILDIELDVEVPGFGLVGVGAGGGGVLVSCSWLCRLVRRCGLLAVGQSWYHQV